MMLEDSIVDVAAEVFEFEVFEIWVDCVVVLITVHEVKKDVSSAVKNDTIEFIVDVSDVRAFAEVRAHDESCKSKRYITQFFQARSSWVIFFEINKMKLYWFRLHTHEFHDKQRQAFSSWIIKTLYEADLFKLA